MKLAVIDARGALISYPVNAGGGAAAARNIVQRLPKYFEVSYYPGIGSVFYADDALQRDKLILELEMVRRNGLYVPDALLDFLHDSVSMSRKNAIARYIDLLTSHSERPDYYFDADYSSIISYIVDSRHPIGNYLAFSSYPDLLIMNETYALARRSGINAFALLQGLGDYPMLPGKIPLSYLRSAGLRSANAMYLARLGGVDMLRRIMVKYLRSNVFKGILAMSEGALKNLGLSECNKCRALKPAVAFDPKLLSYRKSPKSNYVIFYARLIPEKGVLELPQIFRHILDAMDMDLIVTSKFFDRSTELAFRSSLRRLNLEKRVKLTGWLPQESLYKTLASAKLLLYPSHSDSFSAVILNSLAVGTPVIAYDIPGPKSVYYGLPMIRFVKEFDKRAMAEEAIRILRMPERDYYDLVNDERVMPFLREHSSWELVVKNVAENLRELAEM
ncbi:glycosyltransferase [Conexivisphaera calida]|uniref:Cell Envelope, Surface polysaccharides and lipopolysaccharides n=1 Tax=Conexivisphaera calida TaxID=1874277 RepID=A0A4P2VPC3_9ARCH|nr:glycosyltransferase [Conexivisphaera calida]BBE42768.1 Cell Envelope, Surface polysaccharides and lipopolysaccharides [Conexivisphaera calida]